MGVTRVCVLHTYQDTDAVLPRHKLFFIQENMKNMKKCDYRPLLLSNRLPDMYLNNPKSDTLRFKVRTRVTFNPTSSTN